MKEVTVIGLDLAKDVFQVHGRDALGRQVFNRQLKRAEVAVFFASLDPCIVGMESCSGCHYWAQVFLRQGHEVRIVPAQYVRPFVKTNKSDALDAEAIAEAATKTNIHFVPPKGPAQLEIQALHRIRSRLVKQRTGLGNEVRGLLHEYGIIAPRKIESVGKMIQAVLDDPEHGMVGARLRTALADLLEEFRQLSARIEQYDLWFKEIAKQTPVCRQLMQVPGIGLMAATQMVAAVPDPKVFKNGRQFAAWIGLVPKQYSSGGKVKLGRISKRGNKELRWLLVHGARATAHAVIQYKMTGKRNDWVRQKMETRGKFKSYIALANKNARIAWNIMAKQEDYRMAA